MFADDRARFGHITIRQGQDRKGESMDARKQATNRTFEISVKKRLEIDAGGDGLTSTITIARKSDNPTD